MSKGPTAKRYARAAFDIAKDAGETEIWLDELLLSRDALSDEELIVYLEAPQISFDDRLKILSSALSDLRPMVMNLLALLMSRNALRILTEVVSEYAKLLDIELGRQHANLTAAVPMGKDHKDRISAELRGLLGQEIILDTGVDQEVLGGLVIRVGDRMIDGSIKGKLTELRKSVTGTTGGTN